MARFVLAGLLFAFALDANAALISRTDASILGGPNNLTFDSTTGLEWLDVTATAGTPTAAFVDPLDPRSGIVDRTNSQALLDAGFRLATAEQVAQLFVNAGIPLSSQNSAVAVLGIESEIISLMDLVGVLCANACSVSPPMGPNLQGGAEIFEPSLNFTAYFPLLGIDPNGGGGYAWTTRSANRGTEATNFGLGNWLVRSVPVPEPNTLMLFLAGIAGSRLRRRPV